VILTMFIIFLKLIYNNNNINYDYDYNVCDNNYYSDDSNVINLMNYK